MKQSKTCPTCGQPFPPGLEGLCPHCMLGTAARLTVEGDAPAGSVPPSDLGQNAVDNRRLAALFPELELIEQIGRGGMGMVYRVRQGELDRFAALKILDPSLADRPGFRKRFRDEARTLAALNHPNIVTIYDFGERGDLFYFLMEYVNGGDLCHILLGEPLPPRQILAVVRQICDAVQYAHDHGVVHRDLKPGNILLDTEGRAKVADFGVAKLLGGEDAGVPGGYVVGTPAYMAPEQRERSTTVDHRADIYSLGAVFYELLTGSPPDETLAPPSAKRVDIDVRLDNVVLRALEKLPERRYQHVSELRTRVDRVAEPRKFPLAWVLLGAVTLVLVAISLRYGRGAGDREAAPAGPPVWENSLGMKLLPVPGADVLMARHETRACDWQAFEASGHATRRSAIMNESERGPEFPVSPGDEHAAEAFCRWLTRTEWASGHLPTNETYRLPTDQEWSLAAGLVEPQDTNPGDLHLADEETYPWGKEAPAPAQAGNYPDAALRERMPNAVVIPAYYDGHATAAPVEQFPPNANGFHDLGGNLWEMVSIPGTNTPVRIAFRGGSWFSGSDDGDWRCLLSSFRAKPFETKSFESGFRIVRAALGAHQEPSLLEAALAGDREAVVRNLSSGAVVGGQLLNQALRHAATAGSADIIEVLLKHGADPNAEDPGGTTALHEAAGAGSLRAVKTLLAAGARPDARTKLLSETPAHRAAQADAVDVLEALDEAGARFEGCGGLMTVAQTAASYGSTHALRWLAGQGVDVNEPNSFGLTPLATAAMTRHYDACVALLELGARVNTPKLDLSPLAATVVAADERIVDLLLAHDAGVTEPHLASALSIDLASGARQATRKSGLRAGSFDGVMSTPPEPGVKARIARRLVEHGLPLELRSENGMTPLLWAAYFGQFEVFQTLLELGADPATVDNEGFSALHSAAEQGFPRIVEALAAAGVDLEARTSEGRTALLAASLNAGERNLDVVQILASRGANLEAADKSGNTVLHYAASRGDAELVGLLIDLGANANATTLKDETPLSAAAGGEPRMRDGWDKLKQQKAFDGERTAIPGPAETGSEADYARCVELLLAAGADPILPSESGRTAITAAAEHDQVEIVRLLLDAGVSADILDRQAMTPLHWAAIGNAVRAATLLIHRGASVAHPLNPMTPLHCAAAQGNGEVVALLLDSGANVSARDGKAASPMHYAVLAGSERVVQLLATHGADPNARDFAYATPLHGAAMKGDADMVRALIVAGADPAARNFEGATSLDLAKHARNMTLVALLETAATPVEAEGDMP